MWRRFLNWWREAFCTVDENWRRDRMIRRHEAYMDRQRRKHKSKSWPAE